ncbi:unnamed protein product, partial [marine sediment metagenome]
MNDKKKGPEARRRADPKHKAEAKRLFDSKKHKLESQGEREQPVIERILKEISIIEKINRQWKDGLITEFQFSNTLDRLLVNLERYQIELKQPGLLEDLK